MGILEIITLITTVAPKLIAAGKSVMDLWNAAGSILKDAETNNGKVDPEAFIALQALVQVQLDKLHENAKEAKGE